MKIISKEDLLKWYNKEYCIDKVFTDAHYIRYVKCIFTEDIYWDIFVNNNGYVPLIMQKQLNLSENFWRKIIKRYPDAIMYADIVKYPSLYQIYQNDRMIKRKNYKTYNSLLRWYDIIYSEKRVCKSPHVFKLVKTQTDQMCLNVVSHHSSLLQFVHNQTESICIAALQNRATAIEFVDLKKFPHLYEYYQFCAV